MDYSIFLWCGDGSQGTTQIAIKYQKLDPADSMGAVDLFTESGLIHPGTESSKPGRMN